MFKDGDFVDINFNGDKGTGIICGYEHHDDVYIVELITRPKFANHNFSCHIISAGYLSKNNSAAVKIKK